MRRRERKVKRLMNVQRQMKAKHHHKHHYPEKKPKILLRYIKREPPN